MASMRARCRGWGLAGIWWATTLVSTNAQPLPFDLNDPVTLYAVMMFYDTSCGGLSLNAKIALFRWQVTISAIHIANQLTLVEDTISRFGLQKFCAGFGSIMTRF
jgi:hypothetical protein